MRINEANPSRPNPLANSASPYLRQHMHNPVYWYPWGGEALGRARAENKPILLSIGYSTCYWCHVMEREVFENPSIAALMNEHFINIKVDREEHPEIDEIYMIARQVMTQEGGWPNNVFLTPELKPFYAGGTYGATDSYNKPAFPRLLEWLNAQWVEDPNDVRSRADEMTKIMEQFLIAKDDGRNPDHSPHIAAARAELAKHHDSQSGGFFQQPKFPHENYLQFLLAHHEATGDQEALDMAVFSLRRMAAGGINDQVGCGFHRYAVDKDWMVPHFEKMLYTQAMLARAYTDAARISKNPYLADVAKSICEFTGGPFTDGRGAFYSAIDAETDGCEGEYYAWSSAELEKILTEDEVQFFIHHYGLADIPHFPGHKHPDGEVIVMRAVMDDAAIAQNLRYEQIAALAGQVMNKLLSHRNITRKAPHLDHKIIVGWNGLMIDALAHAGMVFGNKSYVQRAFKAADHLLKTALNHNGELMRCVTGGKPQHRATLEDHAFLVKGLITLYEATKDDAMLAAAITLMDRAEEKFEDIEQTGFFSMEQDDLLPVRTKNGDDSTLPSANAIMAENYLRLFQITGEAEYRDQAEDIVSFFLSGTGRTWLEYTTMLTVAMKLQGTVDVAALPAAETMQKVVEMSATMERTHGDMAELALKLKVRDGWWIQAGPQHVGDGTATRVDVHGDNVRALSYEFPKPSDRGGKAVYEGVAIIRVQLALPAVGEPKIRVLLRYHPCDENACFASVDDAIEI